MLALKGERGWGSIQILDEAIFRKKINRAPESIYSFFFYFLWFLISVLDPKEPGWLLCFALHVHYILAMRWSVLAINIVLTIAYAARANDDPNNPDGVAYWISKPACDSYSCEIKIHPGDDLKIEWLNPEKGQIAIYFDPDECQENGEDLHRFTIKDKIDSYNDNHKCDPLGQQGCGSFDWKIPKDFKTGRYSVELVGITDKKMHSYSDIVNVLPGDKHKRQFKRISI